MRRGHARIRIVEAHAEVTAEAFAAAQDLFAELIALTFARENPQLFGLNISGDDESKSAGVPAAAAEVGSAPLPSAGAPAKWSVEHHEPETKSG